MPRRIAKHHAARGRVRSRRAIRPPRPALAGVELYFDDLASARDFYRDVLGLKIADEHPGHHAQFNTGAAFLCLEAKGAESYPSCDKAVVFFEVADLASTITGIGRDRFCHIELVRRGLRPLWAVLHDPEGHNLLFLEKPSARKKGH